MPETRDSYSFAQIPVCTTLWYPLVHTTSWSALCAWTLNFSLSVMVLPWHTSRTAESPSHSYFSFLPSSLSVVSESFTLLPSTLMTFHFICMPLLISTNLQLIVSESILVCFNSNPSSNSPTPFSTITRRSTLSTTLFFTDHPVQHSIILFETNNTLLSSLLLHTLDLLLHCDNASWWFHCWSCAPEQSDPSSSTLSFFGSHSNSSFSFSFRFRQVD